MFFEPHQKQLGGLMISEPNQNVVLNDIRVPPKYFEVSMISEIYQIFFLGVNDMRDPMSEPLQINIYKMFIFECKSLDYRYT